MCQSDSYPFLSAPMLEEKQNSGVLSVLTRKNALYPMFLGGWSSSKPNQRERGEEPGENCAKETK